MERELVTLAAFAYCTFTDSEINCNLLDAHHIISLSLQEHRCCAYNLCKIIFIL